LADLHQKLAKAQNAVSITKVIPPTMKEKDGVTAAQKVSTPYSTAVSRLIVFISAKGERGEEEGR